MKNTISVLVENQPGILSKVAGLFSRRGFNIDSLAVGVTDDSSISRITIVVDGDDYVVEQVEKQLNKLIQVIKVKTLEPGQYISRELSLIKVTCHASNRGDVMRVAELMGARIIDVTTTCLTLEFADTAERTDTLLDLLRPFGFKEIVRAGAIAIEKGEKTTALKK
jgi:acetolactate synthase-1/3 small subunit